MNACSPASLSDAELLVRVKQLAQSERQATAALVAHLAEMETRRLYLGQGYASLFGYCTKVLHLSEHAAYNRIEAAKAAVRFPVILVRLAQGDVHLSAVKLLAPLLTPENHRELLDAAKHKSKREVEEMVARLRPQPDAPASVSKLPSSKGAATPTANPESLFVPGAAPSDTAQPDAAPDMPRREASTLRITRRPLPQHHRGPLPSFRWHPSATKCNSRRVRRPMRSCGRRRRCCGIRSRRRLGSGRGSRLGPSRAGTREEEVRGDGSAAGPERRDGTAAGPNAMTERVTGRKTAAAATAPRGISLPQ